MNPSEVAAVAAIAEACQDHGSQNVLTALAWIAESCETYHAGTESSSVFAKLSNRLREAARGPRASSSFGRVATAIADAEEQEQQWATKMRGQNE